jgi:flagellar motility protein MotE (MotC chaperone)
MELLKQLSVMGLATLMAASTALAQTNVNTSTQPTRDGQVVAAESPAETDSANVTAVSTRPARPERSNLPPEVQARIEQFKEDRRAYLAQQEALKKQLQGANDEERAAIRERIKELREQWAERAKELRREYKERQAELADRLTEYRELLNDVRSTAVQSGSGSTRRGDD